MTFSSYQRKDAVDSQLPLYAISAEKKDKFNSSLTSSLWKLYDVLRMVLILFSPFLVKVENYKQLITFLLGA